MSFGLPLFSGISATGSVATTPEIDRLIGEGAAVAGRIQQLCVNRLSAITTSDSDFLEGSNAHARVESGRNLAVVVTEPPYFRSVLDPFAGFGALLEGA